MAMFGPFMVNIYLNNMFYSFILFFLLQIGAIKFRFHAFKRPKQYSKFNDFWILGRAKNPRNQHYLSLETPGYLNKIKNNPWNIFEKCYVCKCGRQRFLKFTKVYVPFFLQIRVPQFFITECEDEDRTMMKIG